MSLLLTLSAKLKQLDHKLKSLTWPVKVNSWIFYNIFGGYECAHCGVKHLQFDRVVCDTKVNDTKMIMSWDSNRGPVCPLCVLDMLKTHFDRLSVDGVCDFTGKSGKVVSGVIREDGIVVIFGQQWWNGWNASLEAFDTGIRNAVMKTSMFRIIDDEIYYYSHGYVSKPQTFQEFIQTSVYKL